MCNLGSSLSENGYVIRTELGTNMNFYLEEERKSQQNLRQNIWKILKTLQNL